MAVTTPMTVTMWFDPYEQTDFMVNAAVTWHVSFTDRVTKAPIDPDTVNMFYSVPLSNAAVAVTPTKDAVGFYHADLQLATVGRWVFTCQPKSSGGVQNGSSSSTLQAFDAAA